jgi:hypothetical protein
VRPWLAVAGVVGALNWGWLVVEVLDRRRTLIVDFESTANPVYGALRALLPDYRSPGLDDWVRQALWLAALALAAALALRPRRRRSSAPDRTPTP